MLFEIRNVGVRFDTRWVSDVNLEGHKVVSIGNGVSVAYKSDLSSEEVDKFFRIIDEEGKQTDIVGDFFIGKSSGSDVEGFETENELIELIGRFKVALLAW